MEKNFYEKFGILQTASQEEIKKAYRRLAKKYHPDLHNGESEYDQIFKEINLIYEVLSDKQKRAEYDHLLSETNSDLEFIHNAYYTENGIYSTTDPLRPIWNNAYTEEETVHRKPSFRSTVIAWVIRIIIFGLLMWYTISRHLSQY